MKRMMFYLLCSCFLLLSVQDVCAGDWRDLWGIQLSNGIDIPDGEWGNDIKNAASFGAQLRYHPWERFAAELSIMHTGMVDGAFTATDRTMGSFHIASTEQERFGMTRILLHDIVYMSESNVRPYISMGGGCIIVRSQYTLQETAPHVFNHTDRKTQYRLGISLGSGVEAHLNNWLGFTAGMGYIAAPKRVRVFNIQAGLTVYSDHFNLSRPVHRLFQQPDAMEKRFAIRVGSGMMLPMGNPWKQNSNASALAGVTFRYHILRHYAIELDGMYAPKGMISEYTSGDTRVRDYVDSWYISLDHNLFLRTGRFRPFVSLGGGYYGYRTTNEQLTTTSTGKSGREISTMIEAGGMNVGTGFDLKFHPLAALTGAVRYHGTFNTPVNKMELLNLSLGINFYAN